MKYNCKIIEDLLPLYADKICSEESRRAVEEHCGECDECQKKLEAMNIALPEDKVTDKPENPMKKARRHFIKVAVVTFLLCLLAVPVCGVIILNTNDGLNHSPSWTSISGDNKVKKLAEDIKKGNAEEAFKKISVKSEDGEIYDINNHELLINDYAAVFGIFFGKYPVSSYDYSAGYSNISYDGTLTLHLDRTFTENIPYFMQINYTVADGKLCMKDAQLGCETAAYYVFDSYNYFDITGKLTKDFLHLEFPGISVAQNLENCFKGDYNAISSVIITKEYAEIVDRQHEKVIEYDRLTTAEKEQFTGMDDIDEERRVYEEKMQEGLKNLCSDYTFVSAYYNPPTYSYAPFMEGSKMFEENHCYSQYIFLDFVTKDGREFGVGFHAKVNNYIECPLAGVYYSDGTPREFKIAFEELFM